jgi:hypothetical protein
MKDTRLRKMVKKWKTKMKNGKESATKNNKDSIIMEATKKKKKQNKEMRFWRKGLQKKYACEMLILVYCNY